MAALTEQVAQLAAKVEALETALATVDSTAPASVSGEREGRYFPDLVQFVDRWLLPTFRRPLSALGMGAWHWCPRWPQHPEAWLVFGALWDQWEQNRTQQLGMIEFTRDVIEMLPTVCGADGPFTRCRTAAGEDGFAARRHEQVPAAPAEPAPPGWWEGWWTHDPDQPDEQAAQLLFPDVEDFVTGLLLPTFRRDLNAVGMRRWHWCDLWWRHDEVVHHFIDLWYLFEARTPQRRLIEFVREVYYLWPHLHGGDGPMRECTPSGTPGGPRHIDLSIASVDHQTGPGRELGDDWLSLLLAPPRHGRPPVPQDRQDATSDLALSVAAHTSVPGDGRRASTAR